jgi:hypothetical protein
MREDKAAVSAPSDKKAPTGRKKYLGQNDTKWIWCLIHVHRKVAKNEWDTLSIKKKEKKTFSITKIALLLYKTHCNRHLNITGIISASTWSC